MVYAKRKREGDVHEEGEETHSLVSELHEQRREFRDGRSIAP